MTATPEEQEARDLWIDLQNHCLPETLLMEKLREARAQAWEEGYVRGRFNEGIMDIANPYTPPGATK